MSESGTLSADVAAAPPAPSGPGARLAAAREAKGFSVGDVSTRLKFSPRQIEALEAEDYLALPGSTFIRGMVRSYARFLGLDAEALLKEVNAKIAPPAAVKVNDLRVPFQGQGRSNRLWLALSGVVLVGAGLVVADWLLREREQARLAEAERAAQIAAQASPAVQEPVQNVPAPEIKPGEPGGPPAEPSAGASLSLAPSEPSAQPALPQGVKRLKLSFAKESWVTVKDADGSTLLNQLNLPGTEKIIEAKPPISITVGNASGVTAALDGEPLKLQPQRNDIAKLKID